METVSTWSTHPTQQVRRFQWSHSRTTFVLIGSHPQHRVSSASAQPELNQNIRAFTRFTFLRASQMVLTTHTMYALRVSVQIRLKITGYGSSLCHGQWAIASSSVRWATLVKSFKIRDPSHQIRIRSSSSSVRLRSSRVAQLHVRLGNFQIRIRDVPLVKEPECVHVITHIVSVSQHSLTQLRVCISPSFGQGAHYCETSLPHLEPLLFSRSELKNPWKMQSLQYSDCSSPFQRDAHALQCSDCSSPIRKCPLGNAIATV